MTHLRNACGVAMLGVVMSVFAAQAMANPTSSPLANTYPYEYGKLPPGADKTKQHTLTSEDRKVAAAQKFVNNCAQYKKDCEKTQELDHRFHHKNGGRP